MLYMRPHSGPFLSFLAYYMGSLRSLSSHRIWGPSDQFLRLLWRPLHACFFCILYRGPSDQFLFILYWGTRLTFFAYYMGAPSDQFLLIQYGGPSQINFFAYYMSPLRLVSLHAIGGYLRSVSSQKIWGPSDQFLRLLYMGPPQISFCAYFFLGGPLSDDFFLTIWGPLRSDFLHTI